jgi:hypothetical protein
MGNVSGSLIGDILQRAQIEADIEKGVETKIFYKKTNKQEFTSYTIIDDLPNNMTKITYVIVGKKEKEELICGICHGINGHIDGCSDTKLTNEKENILQLPKILSKEGTIFQATDLFNAEIAADVGEFI